MTDAFALDKARLEDWATAQIAGFSGPVAVKKFTTGQSNPTYLLETPSARYVLRRKPSGNLLKSAHAVDREFRVLRALESVSFPAPRALALCEDESVVGSMFYVMSYVEGRIFWDPALPGLTPAARAAIYDFMNEALARLHAIDVVAIGLGDYGKPGNYFARQWRRWSEQYRASETRGIAEMDRLMAWLADNMPRDDGRAALVHGDWRIDNMIFDNASARPLAVLDWELSTLGHPFADLAYQCMQWRMPNVMESRRQVGDSRGLGGLDRAALGVPTETEYVAAYCRRMEIAAIPDWTFLLAFSFFRYAAIAQGVYKRSLDGNASSPERARQAGEAVPLLARLAIEVIETGA